MWPAGLGGRWQCEEVAVVWGDGAARAGPPLTALFAPLGLFSSFSLSACFPRRLPLLQASACTLSSRPLFPSPRTWAQSPGTPCGETSGVTLQDLGSESSGSWRGRRPDCTPSDKGQRWGDRVRNRSAALQMMREAVDA